MAEQWQNIRAVSELIRDNISKVIVGKEHEISLILTAMLAGGHVLLEDVPGTGKTMLARSLARSIDASFNRVQFTPDLLPSDLTGINFYQPKTGDFVFRPGPVFTNILLADEINRATPRTQSSLLECMEEQQVSIDGETRRLDAPFFVIATQNPVETQGTYPLPEAQLDRFFLQIPLGYPGPEDGREVIRRHIGGSQVVQNLQSVCSRDQIMSARDAADTIYLHESILDYIMRLTEATRDHEAVALGVSPRGSLALARGARVRAAMQGRGYVVPDDVQALIVPVCAHRLILRGGVRSRSAAAMELMEQIGGSVTVPSEDFQRES
ncbi:MAG: MoxR family ATPase [Eubacteriales bacterium]|nr:MoxR family ATPase [Eubacteriales bacterium]MDD3867725.1 MoxR family ATPase [Eubacteriales bacterium]MDD4461001.1 MoxR family ATPase [Eubacteriales bacterium]